MSKLVWGVSALHHDAALCVIELGHSTAKVLYASHAERYSRIKNDPKLSPAQIKEALEFGKPEEIFWYEDPVLKHKRWLMSGQIHSFLSEPWPRSYLKGVPGMKEILRGVDVIPGKHHQSHLYSGLATLPFSHEGGVSLIIDAIGEYQTSSVWYTTSNNVTRLVSEEVYPKSIGLLYATLTQYVGLKPMEEEFILMGMAAYGHYTHRVHEVLLEAYNSNLYKGLSPTHREVLKKFRYVDIAATLQAFVAEETVRLLKPAFDYAPSFLSLGGGAALNCVNNASLAYKYNVPTWIFPNAGDAGTCIGAVMQHYPTCHIGDYTPFTGTDAGSIADPYTVVQELLRSQAVGVCQGKAEFGPRALGNRSVLADPRNLEVKARVNQYKNRQQFRPLAPMVLEEHASEFFEVPTNVLDSARYMQVTATANPERAKEIPAVVHADNTARVQLIRSSDPAHAILTEWYAQTGCPVLLNTSLNVRGEPLVNVASEAYAFQATTGIKVFA